MMTIDIKNEIEKVKSTQISTIQFSNMFPSAKRFFLRVLLNYVLRQQRKELKKLKSFFLSINKASQEEVLVLMDVNRFLEKSSKESKELIKNKNITGKNRIERLILENNLLLSECASILASKLYMPKPADISAEDWKKYAEEIRAWAGDDWDDPSYDVYDVDYAPILAK